MIDLIIKRFLSLFSKRKDLKKGHVNFYSYRSDKIDFNDLLEYFYKSYTLQSVYNFMDAIFSSITFYKVKNNEKFYDEKFDNMISKSLSSWYVLGAFLIRFNDNDYDIKPAIRLLDSYDLIKRDSFLFNADGLFKTILEYERIVYEIFKNSYNTTFLIPKDSDIVTLPSEIEDAIDVLKNNRIYTQTGGIGVLKTNFDKLEITSDFQKYDLENIRRHIIKMISFYFSIPIELLSDGETTFNNKQNAMIYFYNTTISSFVNDFIQKINEFSRIYNYYTIDYSFEGFYLLDNIQIETKNKLVDFYKKVLETGDEGLKVIVIDKIKDII